jgi:hypothetical protein
MRGGAAVSADTSDDCPRCREVVDAILDAREDATCPGCGQEYRWRGSTPDARVRVATMAALRPSAVPPVARLTTVEDGELVRVRRLLTELRPDKGGPLGWAADGQAPAALGSNWTPALRVQTSVEVPAILPGAFASRAVESRAPRLDPSSVLGWLQRAGTLAGGLRALYDDCAKACAGGEARAKWEALPARAQHPARVVHGRGLVLAAMAGWWREGTASEPAGATEAERAADGARWASQATGEALARVRDRMGA